MPESYSADVRIGSRAVIVCQAVKIAAVDVRGLTVNEGDAVVRKIVFFLLVIAQCQARRCVDADGECRRNSIGVVVNLIAVHDTVALIHQGDADRGGITQGLVEIARAANVIRLAPRYADRGEWGQQRLLADAIDDARGRAAAEYR